MKYDRSPSRLRRITLSALLIILCGCDSTSTMKLTSDPKLLEKLLDETTRHAASITMADDSVYTREAYRVTVRADTLEWFEHDTEWYAAGLNDVKSVTISKPKPWEGLAEGALLGPLAGMGFGLYFLIAPSDNTNEEESAESKSPMTSEG